MALSIVILAAGQGKRMRSSLPKVLHPLAAKPLLSHVIDSAKVLNPNKIVVVIGHGGEQVRDCLAQYDVEWVTQAEQLGTGHAVMQALPAVPADDKLLILYGDVPLISPTTVQRLAEVADAETIALLGVRLLDPSGYGRILRDKRGAVVEIVEEKDADEAQKRIDEVNTGIMAAPAAVLTDLLARVGCDNAQQEYYLTDVIRLGREQGLRIEGQLAANEAEVAGVNSRGQLAALERIYQRQVAEQLMEQGVTLIDPERIDVRGQLEVGTDTLIDVGCVFEGAVRLGNNVRIGANCVLRNCSIGDGVEIKPFSMVEDSSVGAAATLGPYARLRPGCTLADSVHIGNFVELKNASIAKGSKVNHLSYVGDSEIGADVNVGAGTITCNYDGANKHLTRIGDGAFIGSNTSLVAPVTIGSKATIGAGSVVSKDAPDGQLTVTRAKQISIANWQRPVKQPK